jgi:hypothetical protein
MLRLIKLQDKEPHSDSAEIKPIAELKWYLA